MGIGKGLFGSIHGCLSLAVVCLAAGWAWAESMPYRVMAREGACGRTRQLAITAAPVGKVGSHFLFSETGGRGGALWANDWDDAGSRYVKSIQPLCTWMDDTGCPVETLTVTHVIERGPVSYFRRKIDPHCGTWYRTDGTTAGTVPIDNLGITLNINFMDGSFATAQLGDMLYFFVEDDQHLYQVWRTDFTDAGSGKVTDTVALGPIVPELGMYALGNQILFFSKDSSGNYWVCRTEGTAARTAKVCRIATPATDGYSGFDALNAGGILYFVCKDSASGLELWKTDGTAAGTGMVKDIAPGSANGLERVLRGAYPTGSNALFFIANDGVNGARLWRTDGTAAGTHILKDRISGMGFSTATMLAQTGATTYFLAGAPAPASATRLWRSDGVTAEPVECPATQPTFSRIVNGTLYFVSSLVDDTPFRYNVLFAVAAGASSATELASLEIPPYPHPNWLALGTRVFFWGDGHLWKTDGTPAGTVKVASTGFTPYWATVHDNALCWFQPENAYNVYSTWRSDGTAEGTRQIQVAPPCPDAGAIVDPYILGLVNGRAIVSANNRDGVRCLWASDGTPTGNLLLHSSLTPYEPGTRALHYTATMGASLYFAAKSVAGSNMWELWKSDGTVAGTAKIVDVGSYSFYGLAACGTTLYVSMTDGGGLPSLYKSDGTTAGTVKVKTVTDAYGQASVLTNLTAAGTTLYFVADASNGKSRMVWSSDGTASGTRKLAEYQIIQTSGGPRLQDLTGFGNKLLFRHIMLVNQDHSQLYDFLMYASSGPLSAPFPLSSATTIGVFNPRRIPILGTKCFFPLWSSANGIELYQSDGTATGAKLIKDICPGKGPCFSGEMAWAFLNNEMYFGAADATHGVELWKTNGTADGTVMVKDIKQATVRDRGWRCQDFAGSSPHNMLACNNAVYFAAADDETGTELWMSRGTEKTTVRLGDIAAGPANSVPERLTQAGDHILFTATDGTDRGTELWAIGLPDKSPANPGAVVLGAASLLWTWEDTSDSETGFTLWSDPGTAEPTTLRATLPPNTTSWRQDGLAANTPHTFQVSSTGENGDSQPTAVFTAWTHAPEPASLKFSMTGTGSVRVTVDPVPPNLAQAQSGLHFVNQTRGLNSGWVQTATGWNCTGLNPNTPYTFIGKARNGAGVETIPAAGTKYTLAVTPYAPVVDNPAVHALDVSGVGGTGNPSYTLYALQVFPAVGGHGWVQADGVPGDEPCFQTAGAWGVTTVTGLGENTEYAFRAVARNGEGADTPPGPAGTARTLDITPPVAVITLLDPNPLDSDTLRFGAAFSEPVGTTFSPADVTVTGTLAGAVAVSGTDPVYTVTVTLADTSADGTCGIALGTGVTDLSGNACAGGASGVYTLTHWAGFTQQPAGARLYTGQSHLLQTAVNTGGLPTAYLWKHLRGDGTVLAGPTTPSWAISQASGGNAGDYWCEVTNGGVMHPSLKVTVSVVSHLRITRQPAGGSAFFGEAWRFSVEADGGYPPLRYQWRKNQQQDCADGTEAEYLIDPLEPGDEGIYNVEIHDSNTDALESYPVRLRLSQRMPAAGMAAMAVMAAALALAGVEVGRSRKRRA